MEEKLIGNINTIEVDDEIGIKSENSPFVSSFYFIDFYDDKVVKKFIKNVERLIRGSKEYKRYIEVLRTNVRELNHDTVLGNITDADVDLEFHHYPFSLYDIIEIVMTNNIANSKKFTSFSIAKEVMNLHYMNNIGLVSLTKTMHELAHSGNIFISKKQIFGDYHKFMEDYSNGLSIDLKSKVERMEDYSNQSVPTDFKGLL